MTTMQTSARNSLESLLGQILDDFLERQDRGEEPDVEEYAQRYPQVATVLRQMLPTLQLIQRPAGDLAGSADPSAALGYVPGFLGDYRILREVGRGGMGVVYEAQQVSLNRQVALKILPFAAAMDPKQLQRFKNEAQAAAHLHHQNIVPVYGVGCERGVHYYAMQYIEGQTLAATIRELRGEREGLNQVGVNVARLETPSPLASPQEATPPVGVLSTEGSTRQPDYFRTVARLGVQAAGALEHAHQMGIVHRDIKPANLLADVRRNLWITDFGLARFQSDAGLTLSGDLLGTLRYMSPEQALAKHGLVDHRTDIYSLGATLYELLTLEPVCPGDGRLEVLWQIERKEPRPLRQLNPAVPADLETIVLKALAKEPESRYASAIEVAEDLERFLEHKPIRAKRPTLLGRTRKWSRRHQGVVVTAGVAVVVLLTTVIIALAVGIHRVREEQQQTEKQRQAALIAQDRTKTSYGLAREGLESVKKLADDPRLKTGDLEDLRRAMLEAEARFFERFVRLRGDEPDFRFEQAQAYNALADITRELSTSDEAVRVYRQALSVLAPLVQDYPAVLEYQYWSARSLNNLGLVYVDMRCLDEAEKAFREALILQEPLINDHAHIALYQSELATMHENLGAVYLKTNRLEEAQQAFQTSIRLNRQLVHDHPEVAAYRFNLAYTLNNLGVLYKRQSRWREAEQTHEEALSLRARLVKDFPEDPSYQYVLAQSLANRGALYKATNRPCEAERAYQDAVQVNQALRRAHPHNKLYATQLGKDQLRLGELVGQTGQLETALAWLSQAIETLEAVLNKERGPTEAQEPLWNAYRLKCNALYILERHGEELQVLNRWIEHFSDRPKAYDVRVRRAKTLAKLKRHAEAAAEAQELLKLPGIQVQALVRFAELYSLAHAAARDDDDPVHAAQYAVQAVQLLRQAVAKGYKDGEALKKAADFEAVRKRPDFQKLLNDLEKGNEEVEP